MNIYVGNLNYASTEEGLRRLFEAYGEVGDVSIIRDRETGRSRGFGFVEMPNEEEARAAIAELDNKEFDGRLIKVNQARPKVQSRTWRDSR
jgi:RNA recognition motif-containing protein